MKTPQFLRELMSSPAYMDKNSKAYAMAQRYLNLLYPGLAQIDATGRMVEPAYDMTLQQFNDAQAEMDMALEETIDVRVLMPGGRIEKKQLEVYTLNLPAGDEPNGETRRVWRWHAEEEENTCGECASRDGQIFESVDDIPPIPAHPNCRCSITEDIIDPDGRTVSSKPYTPKASKKRMKQKKI